MFALMMARVDRRIGATHYTLLASVEVFGKSPATWLSGLLAERLGYAGLFLLGVGTVVGFRARPAFNAQTRCMRPGRRRAAADSGSGSLHDLFRLYRHLNKAFSHIEEPPRAIQVWAKDNAACVRVDSFEPCYSMR